MKVVAKISKKPNLRKEGLDTLPGSLKYRSVGLPACQPTEDMNEIDQLLIVDLLQKGKYQREAIRVIGAM